MIDYRLPLSKILFALAAVAAFCLLNPASAMAADPSTPGVLCLPGVYQADPENCLAIGPSTVRTQQAKQGMPLPLAPTARCTVARRTGCSALFLCHAS